MYWTLELASKLEDAPWPATKDELLDYANRIGAPAEVIENLEELEATTRSSMRVFWICGRTIRRKMKTSSSTRRSIEN